MARLQAVHHTQYSRKSVLFLVSLFAILLVVLLLVIFSFSHSASVNSSGNTSTTDLAPSTSASQVLTTYYYDITHADYESAYTLLSTPVHQHLDLQGGAAYLQSELAQVATKYGAITGYTIAQPPSNATTQQMTYLVRIIRAKFTAQQTETDTYRLVRQGTIWAIDQWTSDVNTK